MFSLLSGMWVYLFGLPQYNVLVLGLDNSGKSTFLYQVGRLCDRKKKSKKEECSHSVPSLKKRCSDQHDDDDDEMECKEEEQSKDPHNLYRLDPKLAQILPTMGQNVKVVDFDNMSLQFWDLPGQQSFRRIWTNYYNEAHAVVFMVDSADSTRLQHAKQELHQLLSDYALRDAPFLVLANKQDMDNAVDYQSIVGALQLIGCQSSTTKSGGSSSHSVTSSSDNESDQTLKGRSLRVMCTCCLNKEGLSDAMSWLVFTIPNAQRRLQCVEQYQLKQRQKVK